MLCENCSNITKDINKYYVKKSMCKINNLDENSNINHIIKLQIIVTKATKL